MQFLESATQFSIYNVKVARKHKSDLPLLDKIGDEVTVENVFSVFSNRLLNVSVTVSLKRKSALVL